MTTPQATRELGQSEAVAYEVAREILIELSAHADARADQERHRSQVDAATVADWTERAEQWAREAHQLRPRDAERVHAVLDEYGELLRTLRQTSA